MPYSKEKRKEYSREYHAKNRDKYRARNRAWAKSHKDKVAASAHRHYLKDKEHLLASAKAWRDANPERVKERDARRAAHTSAHRKVIKKLKMWVRRWGLEQKYG